MTQGNVDAFPFMLNFILRRIFTDLLHFLLKTENSSYIHIYLKGCKKMFAHFYVFSGYRRARSLQYIHIQENVFNNWRTGVGVKSGNVLLNTHKR